MLRRGDDRAVSALVGAVLLLGIFVVALSVYQLNVVPSENYEVEVNHNERVQGELQDLRNTIVSVPGGNSGGSTTVTLGTTYPERTFTVNPPPASGTLQTEELGEVRIENATASDEHSNVEKFWNRDEWTRTTYGLKYTPDYNEYRNAPETIYEHGLLYNRHADDASISVADQLLVDDDELTLVTLQGDLSESSSGSVSVDTRALSTSSNTITLENEGEDENIAITLPTTTPSHWNGTLSDAERVVDGSIDEGDQNVTFELESGEYSIQMAEVGVGSVDQGSPEERAEYIYYDNDTPGVAIVEVRDQFNNPLKNVDVTIDPDDGSEEVKSTGSNGRIVIEEDSTVTVNKEDGELEAHIVVKERGSEGTTENAYDVEWNVTEIKGEDEFSDDDCSEDVCIEEGESGSLHFEPEVDAGFAEFAVENSSVGELSNQGDDYLMEFDPDSRDVTFEGNELGTTEVWVLAGGDNDKLTIEVRSPSPSFQLATDYDDTLETGDDLSVDATVSNDGGADGEVTVNFDFEDGEVEDSQTLEIDANDAETATFTAENLDEEGDYAFTISAEDDEFDDYTGTVTVTESVMANQVTIDDEDGFNNPSEVEFTLVAENDVNITNIGINYTDVEEATIVDNDGDAEFEGEEGYLNRGEGDGISIGEDPIELDTFATIEAESDEEFTLVEFRDDDGDDVGNMNNQEVEIMIVFEDGSQLSEILET